MRLAVMQPYFFPYLGYYQLARSVDHFVFLDDAAFIKSGFINRNQILVGGQPFRFTIPVAEASQNRPIMAHQYTGQFRRFLLQLRQEYAHAPFFASVFPMIEALVLDADLNVARKNADSIRLVFDHLGLPLSCAPASQSGAGTARGQERILALCERHGATAYHNASGGKGLYDAAAFATRGIQLRFLHNRFPIYAQGPTGTFVPGLSIIDVLMHVPPQEARAMLEAYDVEPAVPGSPSGASVP